MTSDTDVRGHEVVEVSFDGTPSWSATSAELDFLEVLLLGCLGLPTRLEAPAPESIDDTAAGVGSVLLDGATATAAQQSGRLLILDEEGAPYAGVVVEGVTPAGASTFAVHGTVLPHVELPCRGNYLDLRRRPERLGTRVLGVPVDDGLLDAEVAQLEALTEDLDADLLLMPLTGAGRPIGIAAGELVRACLRVTARIGGTVTPVSLPARRDTDRATDVLPTRIALAYGATHLLENRTPFGAHLTSGAAVVLPPGVALDSRSGRWARLELVPVEHRAATFSGRGAPRSTVLGATPGDPGWGVPHPLLVAGGERRPCGVVVMLTGLSGSGKSTVARAMAAVLEETRGTAVTLLDGDIVRRRLSSELTFSPEHRRLNVLRIGFVAAEVARHGGTAICAPIAPYAADRHEVREMVLDAGGDFVLVHVSTPLSACEQRDRKGLYAKARRGEIPDFTGVSAPYETPDDADVVIDTSRLDVTESVDSILRHCAGRGLLLAKSDPVGSSF